MCFLTLRSWGSNSGPLSTGQVETGEGYTGIDERQKSNGKKIEEFLSVSASECYTAFLKLHTILYIIFSDFR